MKRSHSPSPSTRAKVQHSSETSDASGGRRRNLSFDEVFYDELILVIFSHLSAEDLCTIQSTNKNWARLSQDNQLWKALYLAEHGRVRVRMMRSPMVPPVGQESRAVKPLPTRAQQVIERGVQEEAINWKVLFKLGENWRNGRCTLQTFELSPSTNVRTDVPEDSGPGLILMGDTIIHASIGSSPTIRFMTPGRKSHTIHATSCSVDVYGRITALALDQSIPCSHSRYIRLASFLSTGEFSIFSVDQHSLTASARVLAYLPSHRTERIAPIIQAAYYHPILLTLSTAFTLSIYDLSEHGKVKHTQTLSSFTSYPPTSITISPSHGTRGVLKVVLVSSVPVYPRHWSVGVTELLIKLGDDLGGILTPPALISTRTVRTHDLPLGWIDEEQFKIVQEQWGRKVEKVVDTQTDGKWVVLAPLSASSSSYRRNRPTAFSNALQQYRLTLPPTPSAGAPKLSFVRYLHGPESDVEKIWVADGRCVSLSVDGGIWVWDLEERPRGAKGSREPAWLEGAQVEIGDDASWKGRGSVVFDERRIATVRGGEVQLRRFDV
ncbi:hypothetical protein BDM02DRAFT_3102756 [Thelephora ganbajun]|uniref:Uncharacterized protein n=1 Tax=Thelephora ganbajun TaxID=370292 RepID=A0ACB6Z488_THEGA|nr:hypothetical protein BDM02DRAFT_3102756 [Thelephora ganbajun]